VAGICDNDGSTLIQRSDDNEEVIAPRLDAFYRQTEPLVRYYTEQGVLENLDAVGEVESVTRSVVSAVERRKQRAA
jgi:adenylate kinase